MEAEAVLVFRVLSAEKAILARRQLNTASDQLKTQFTKTPKGLLVTQVL